MLYTRKGDDGSTGLFGTSQRFKKNSPKIEALGTLDEANSFLGIVKVKSLSAFVTSDKFPLGKIISDVQENLFIIQAELAGSNKKISSSKITILENLIAAIELELPIQKNFIISGKTEIGSLLDYARTLTRKAERAVINLSISKESLAYLNRLSSLLFGLARFMNIQDSSAEKQPQYK